MPKLLLLALFVLVSQINVLAQKCNTKSTHNSYFSTNSYHNYSANRSNDKIKVAVHFIADKNGNLNSFDSLAFTPIIDSINSRFLAVNIELVLSKINIVLDSGQMFYLDVFGDPTDINYYSANSISEPCHLNIFVSNNTYTNDNFASKIGGNLTDTNFIFISHDDVVFGNVFHEIGHLLGLYHTHDTFYNYPELVDGSNCSIAGDLICDTPADPGLSGKVNDNTCSLISPLTATDANGDFYAPQLTNFMSYTPFSCQIDITQMQLNVMRNTYDYNAAYFNGCNLTSVKNNNKKVTIKTFPNPTNGILNIEINDVIGTDPINIEVYSVQGNLIQSILITSTKNISINLSENNKGFYFLKIIGEDFISTEKVLLK